MRPVVVLLTCDIHTHNHGPDPVHEDLARTRKVLGDLSAPCTFFFPANSAETLREEVATLAGDGHEIGCHGLTHTPDSHNAQPNFSFRHFLSPFFPHTLRNYVPTSGPSRSGFRTARP